MLEIIPKIIDGKTIFCDKSHNILVHKTSSLPALSQLHRTAGVVLKVIYPSTSETRVFHEKIDWNYGCWYPGPLHQQIIGIYGIDFAGQTAIVFEFRVQRYIYMLVCFIVYKKIGKTLSLNFADEIPIHVQVLPGFEETLRRT